MLDVGGLWGHAILQIDVYEPKASARCLPRRRTRWDKPRSTPPTRMPLTARSVVRLDAARALAGSLKRDIELADPAELSQPATVQEFGQRQQQLSDRAEHCLQGTLRDRALLREVEKLLRNVELDTEPDEADSQHARRASSTAASAGSSSSAGYLPRPSGSTVLRGGALSARRATTSLRAGAAPQYRPASAREAAAQASGTQGEAAAVAVGVVPESVMARDARRLAHCDALTSQLQSVQLDFEAHWSQRLDAVAAGHARLQREMDAALDISEEEMQIEIEKHRRAAEAEAEEEAEEDGAGARAAASALGRYLAGQQRVAHGGQPARPTDRQASTVASRRPAAGSVAPVGGGRGGGGSLRGAGRGAARGVPRPRRVPEGHEESSVR